MITGKNYQVADTQPFFVRYVKRCYKNPSNLRKVFFLFYVIYLFSIGISVSLASTVESVDPSDNNSKAKSSDPQFKTDSTEVTEQQRSYNPEEAEMGNFSTTSTTTSTSEMKDAESTSQSGAPAKDNYYNNEEDADESSQSMISFNFLYYLLQKFKLSNSLGY